MKTVVLLKVKTTVLLYSIYKKKTIFVDSCLVSELVSSDNRQSPN